MLGSIERKYSEIEQKYVELTTGITEKGEKQAVSQPARVTTAVSRKGSADKNRAVPADVAQGSMLFADFAAKYGVPRGTFSYHVKHGIAGDIVETVPCSKPGRPDHTEYWLSPEQQMAALAFWDRHGVKHNKHLDVE